MGSSACNPTAKIRAVGSMVPAPSFRVTVWAGVVSDTVLDTAGFPLMEADPLDFGLGDRLGNKGRFTLNPKP